MKEKSFERKSRPLRPAISGVLLVDKPLGWTSHDVIAKLRGATGIKRIGHAGTLDPAATGVLVIMLGPATRLSQYLLSQDKTYRATFKFGIVTDTDDADGTIIETNQVDAEIFSQEFAEKAVAALVGKHAQIPPTYSAVKIDGVVAHKAARSGNEPTLTPRDIEILDARLICTDQQALTWDVELKVSKGTYIRSIARDLGIKLGCGAHVLSLCRTASGSMTIDSSHSLDSVLEAANKPAGVSTLIIDVLDLFPGDKVYSTDIPILQGKFLSAACLIQSSSDADISTFGVLESLVPVVSFDNRLLAIYRKDDDLLKPETVFPGGVYGPNIKECVATIGTFDGVHTGHADLLDCVVSQASEQGLPSVAITFDPLPQSQLGKDSGPTQISTLRDRVTYIKGRGVDHVIIIPFTPDTASLSPEQFITEVIYARCTPSKIIVGENFRFGKGATAGPAELRELMAITKTDVKAVKLVTLDEQAVSSTRIREAILSQDIETANRLLGRRISFSGTVIKGAGIGAQLGYPTANIDYSTANHLPPGIYAGFAKVEAASGRPANTQHKAAIFIGRPREDNNEPTIEVHILDGTHDLYGEPLFIEVEAFIGTPSRYENIDGLKKGIQEFIDEVRLNLEGSGL